MTLEVKSPPASAGDRRDTDAIPGPGDRRDADAIPGPGDRRDADAIPGPGRGGRGSPPAFLPRESHGQRSLADDSPLGRREPDATGVTEHTGTHTYKSLFNKTSQVLF